MLVLLPRDGEYFVTGNPIPRMGTAMPNMEPCRAFKTKDDKRKFKTIKVYESYVKLRNYEGEVRQFIITDHGRPQPTFMITNDFVSNRSTLIKKYARRWLVEQEIAELIKFFHLNQTSSSIVVKVDFDLTMSLLAHNLYQLLTRHLPGFERCNAYTIYRNFIENGAKGCNYWR
jgi:hypothetical protein